MSIYDGKPSIELDHRPFYTITIPCYNSRNKLPRLLDSILDQDMNDDIEIIICDDHSTEDYQDIIDKYKDKLCIRQIQTEYNCCPGNTREIAAQHATGIWLTNCDHDDSLSHGALKLIKNEIEKNNEQYMVISRYKEVYIDDDGNITKTKNMDFDFLLTHGKFFNLDNLWKKYDIHYKKDLKTHEDIYVSKLINVLLKHEEIESLEVPIYTYNFYQHSDSINNTRYAKAEYEGMRHPFIEVNYYDWCEANYGIYPYLVSKKLLDIRKFLEYMLALILYDYAFLQGFMYVMKDNYIKRNLLLAKSHLKFIKSTFNLTNEQIIKYLDACGEESFNIILKSVKLNLKCNYEFTYTFEDWIEYLDGKE